MSLRRILLGLSWRGGTISESRYDLSSVMESVMSSCGNGFSQCGQMDVAR